MTELRLKQLYGVVDEIIVVESRITHSGKRKDFLYTDRDREKFDPYIDKVLCSCNPLPSGRAILARICRMLTVSFICSAYMPYCPKKPHRSKSFYKC